jgi:hypothetical protein
MFLVGLLQWWYGRGWMDELRLVGHRLRSTSEFFSIGQLAATLFSPFRQISAGRVGGPVGVQLRAFLDRLISRIIGAIVRSGTIIAGIVTLTLQAIFSTIRLIAWFILPALPIAGLILFAIGWTPQWI